MDNGGRLGTIRMNGLAMGNIELSEDYEYVEPILVAYPYPNVGFKIVDVEMEPSLPLEHPNVLGGGILLPPIDALIAEQDGDEAKYNTIYYRYLTEDSSVTQFMQAIISALILGIDILLYSPNPDKLATNKKLIEMMIYIYGIDIGLPLCKRASYTSDPNKIKVWLNMAYDCAAISPREYLFLYPGYPDNPPMIQKLIYDLCLIEKDPVATINLLSVQLKEKPNLILPVYKCYY